MALLAWSKHSRGWNTPGFDTRSRIQHYSCKTCRDSNTEPIWYNTSLETSKSLGKWSRMEWTLERPVSNSIHVLAISPNLRFHYPFTDHRNGDSSPITRRKSLVWLSTWMANFGCHSMILHAILLNSRYAI